MSLFYCLLSRSFCTTYMRFIKQSFDLWDVAAPPIPSITLSLRHRTKAVRLLQLTYFKLRRYIITNMYL
jgi:hypothetical protein